MKKKITFIIALILVISIIPKAYAAKTGIVTATSGLKLRTAPSTSGRSLGTMTYKSEVSIL